MKQNLLRDSVLDMLGASTWTQNVMNKIASVLTPSPGWTYEPNYLVVKIDSSKIFSHETVEMALESRDYFVLDYDDSIWMNDINVDTFRIRIDSIRKTPSPK